MALLSGEMMVEQRAAVIERFREGKEKVLVTTNVCARGKQRLALFTRLGVPGPPCEQEKYLCLWSHGGGRVLGTFLPREADCHGSKNLLGEASSPALVGRNSGFQKLAP